MKSMNKIFTNALKSIIVFSIFVFNVGFTNSDTEVSNNSIILKENDEDENDDPNNTLSSMNKKQLNAIEILNYMTVLSEEINSSSNKKLFLDNIFSDLLNNTNKSSIDEETLLQINNLINTIVSYQSVERQKKRANYIYEQSQAAALEKAIPEPMSVLNVAISESEFIPSPSLSKLISVIYLAVDARNSYKEFLDEAEENYLFSQWELEDALIQNLNESRTNAFNYMAIMCNKYNLDDSLILNEDSVEKFVQWENQTNATRKLEFFEKNKKTYMAYGKYWLVLAETYHQKKDYKKCLESVSTYEKMNINVFRKDRDYAKTLTIAIDSASRVYKGEEYIKVVETYLKNLLKNTDVDDWALKYFAAQTYMDLSVRSDKKYYLEQAYELVKENINNLIDIQRAKNKEFLEDVSLIKAEKDASKERKKEIDSFNKLLKEERKKALPPVYKPLVVNCELLFGLIEKLNKSAEEKEIINEILHQDDNPLFLMKTLEEKYLFDSHKNNENYTVVYNGKSVEIPAYLLESASRIKVTVTDNNIQTVFDDWILDKVERKTKDDINSFKAIYKSKTIEKYKYTDGAKVKIEIIAPENEYKTISFEFKVSKNKKFGFINDVIFEQIK